MRHIEYASILGRHFLGMMFGNGHEASLLLAETRHLAFPLGSVPFVKVPVHEPFPQVTGSSLAGVGAMTPLLSFLFLTDSSGLSSPCETARMLYGPLYPIRHIVLLILKLTGAASKLCAAGFRRIGIATAEFLADTTRNFHDFALPVFLGPF